MSRRIRGLLAEPGAALAMIDRHGGVAAANAAFLSLGGLACLAPEGLAALHSALASGQACAVPAGQGGVAATVTPLGMHAGALVRLTDTRPQRERERQLEEGQRLQAVGQLAAGIAHDFNNILTAIQGAAEALRPDVAAGAQAELAVIRDGAARGAALIRQLLAFTGQQTLRPQIVALNDAVRALAGLLARLIGRQIALALHLEEPGRYVRIDPGQLDQVLINLAVNARDAMPGGGTLSISTAHRVVLNPEREGSVTLPPGRYAVLEMRDTGCGMGPDILARIFEPFFTTRRGAGGTGLGLSTVHGIVHQSGGALHVESAPGQGTLFRITLPRAEPPPPAPPPPRPAGHRALVVDDEMPVRALAARILRRAGWEVAEAASGDEALEEAPDALDVLVSDVAMPGLDGPGLAAALRLRFPDLRVVLMSGYADAAQRAALAEARIDFVAKPFAAEALIAAVGAAAAR